MGKDLSKDDHIAFEELHNRDVQLPDVRDDFSSAVAYEDFSQSAHPMSFHQFFTAVEQIIGYRKVTFASAMNKAYSRLPSSAYDFFGVQSIKDAYQEFNELRGAYKNEELINAPVALRILKSLTLSYEGAEVASASSIKKVKLIKPEEVKQNQGQLLRDNPDFAKRYREEFNEFKSLTKVPFAAVWNSLPAEMVQGHSLLSYKNGSNRGSDRNNLSVNVCVAILDIYKKLPHFTASASAYDVNGPFVLGDHYGLTLSPDVAYAQIKEARKTSKMSRQDVITKYAQLTDSIEERRLLIRKSAHEPSMSRLKLNVILNLLEGRDVPAEAITLLKYFSKNAKLLPIIGEKSTLSSGVKFDSEGMLLPASQGTSEIDLTETFKSNDLSEVASLPAIQKMTDTFNLYNRTRPKPAGYNRVFGIVDEDNKCTSLTLG